MIRNVMYRGSIAVTLIMGLISGTATGQVPVFLEIANPNPVGSGARAMGMANAFIAVADDATAASWNPGGLSQLERPELSFAFESVMTSETTAFQGHHQESFDFRDLNYFSVVYPIALKSDRNVAISINYLKLFNFEREATLPFNLDLSDPNNPFVTATAAGGLTVDQTGNFSVLAPSASMDITPNLSLGLTVNIWNHSITGDSAFERNRFSESTLTVTPPPPIPVNQTTENKITKDRYEVDDGYSLVFGGLYRLSDSWQIGWVVKPPYTLDLDHSTLRITTTTAAPTPRASVPPTVDTTLEFPWTLGIGATVRPSDRSTLSFDVTWTQWSEYRFRENGLDANPLTGNREKLEDTVTLRFGGEFLLIREQFIVPLRAGIGYDPGPSEHDADEFFTMNIGTGVQLFERINIDLAYEFRWGHDVNTTTFGVTQESERHRILASLIYYF